MANKNINRHIKKANNKENIIFGIKMVNLKKKALY